MKTTGSRTILVAALAFLCGAAFMAAFLLLNDPDELHWKPVQVLSWIVLFPASLLAAWVTGDRPPITSIAILAGVFFGTCVTLLAAYFSRANLFPIVATLWTVMAVPSVAVGGLLGWAAHSIQNRFRRKST
jgi:peptidoglycan/LPS O-acetylase OafA/YrhL